MRGPVAKRMKRARTGEPMMMEEADEFNSEIRSLAVDTGSSDDETSEKNDLESEVHTTGARDQRRMEMNSAKKVKERARRGKMADSVRSLRMLVPSCIDEKKVNQSQVLSNTVVYITKMQAQLQSLQREVEQLKAQLSAASLIGDQPPSSSSFKSSPQFASRQNAPQGSSRAKTTNSAKSQFNASSPAHQSTTTPESFPVIKLTTTTSRSQRTFRAAPIPILSSPSGSPTAESPPYPTQHRASIPSIPHDTRPTSMGGIAFQNGANADSDPSTPLALRSSPQTQATGPIMAPFVPFLANMMPHSGHNATSSNSSSSRHRNPHISNPISLQPRFQAPVKEELILSTTPIGDSPFDQHFESGDAMVTSNSPYQVDDELIGEFPEHGVQSTMSLDDIEDVGKWPLYHNHDAPIEPEGAEMQYSWSIPPSERHMGPTRHTHTFPHDHSLTAPVGGTVQGTSVCECGKAPVYAQYF